MVADCGSIVATENPESKSSRSRQRRKQPLKEKKIRPNTESKKEREQLQRSADVNLLKIQCWTVLEHFTVDLCFVTRWLARSVVVVLTWWFVGVWSESYLENVQKKLDAWIPSNIASTIDEKSQKILPKWSQTLPKSTKNDTQINENASLDRFRRKIVTRSAPLRFPEFSVICRVTLLASFGLKVVHLWAIL